MADERRSSAMMLAFLCGAVLGAVAALVLAPESGQDARDRMRRYVRRAGDNLADLAGRAGRVYEEVVGQGKEYVESKKSALREAFEAGREAMRRERDRPRGEGSQET